MDAPGFSWRAVALAFFLGMIAGSAGAVWLQPQPQAAKPAETVAAAMNTALVEKKEIAYVEKQNGEKTDVELTAAKPKVTVSVNGQQRQLELATKENQKFEKGKLVITEESQLRLDIKTPQPRFNLGVGWGTHGPALTLGGRLGGGPAGWWLYGDRRTMAGGLTVPLGR